MKVEAAFSFQSHLRHQSMRTHLKLNDQQHQFYDRANKSIPKDNRQDLARKHEKFDSECNTDSFAMITSSCNRRNMLASSAFVSGMMLSSPQKHTVQTANALSPEAASSSYDAYASSYDELDGGPIASFLGINSARSLLLNNAKGRVLEIGVGTGLNIDKYNFSPDGVTSVVFLDISEGMLQQARARAENLGIVDKLDGKIEFVKADATSNQIVEMFGRNSFDTVVDTFSLCVLGNKGAQICLDQLKDSVKRGKDGGRILLLENSRANNPLLGWYQDVTADAAADIGGKGCVYNQDVGSMIRKTGLVIEDEKSFVDGVFRYYVCSRL